MPITPDPGTTGFSSSSKTTVLPSTVTVGPLFMAVSPLPMVAMPLLPDSEDPTASTMTRFGKCSKKASFTGAENRAADEVTARSEVRS